MYEIHLVNDMKNSFYVTACRFHTKEKNKLLIIGYFHRNVMGKNTPVILLDNEKLTYIAEEHRLIPTQFREINGKKITKEYYLWVQLPPNWKEYGELKIYNHSSEEPLMCLSRDKLITFEQWIARNIDVVKKESDRWKIEGWYINTGKTKISFRDMEGTALPVDMTHVERADVLRAYPENEKSEIIGFSAVYKGQMPRKIYLHLETEEQSNDEIVTWKRTYKTNILGNAKQMAVKIKVYYQQFGLEETAKRAYDKLTKHEYTDYEQWMRRYQTPKSVLRKQRKASFGIMPKISIVVPLYKTPEKYLREFIASVQKQSYTNWELCLSDGSGMNSPLTKILKNYEKKDKRIRVVYNEEQFHISDNTNKALEICTGDYIAFADHDDLLTPDALYECVKVLNEEPQTELIYSDEDKVNMDGTEYFLPHFKSDYSLDLLRTNNYFCHLVVVKRELYEKVGFLDSRCDGAQDFDFVLRCVEQTSNIKHIAKVLYHWRAHQDSTAGNPDSKPYITKAGIRAVQGHYDRLGIKATVSATRHIGVYRSKFELEDTPLVSIIIPNKDHVDDLDKCIRSVEEICTYKNIEYVVVENNSQEERTFSYYEDLQKRNKKVRVVYWDRKGFNYSAINNYGVRQARGEYLLFLNNDTEMLNSDCIEELLVYGMREDVGAVGAKMYYEDGTVQHAGVIVGLGGVAGHAFLGIPHDYPGYCCRADVPQNMSAVTAACMLMRRKVYEEAGGFDEEYAVAFNDVDLCLKVRKAGYLIVYNPHVELIHYESKSRGYEDTEEKIARFASEVRLFQERWEEFLEQGDPYYNPNLTLDRNDFSLNATGSRERG